MHIGVNVPNVAPETDPDVLRRWAQTVEGLGFDLLVVSDHIVVTPDVAEQYPAPFYEPVSAPSIRSSATSTRSVCSGRRRWCSTRSTAT